MQVDDVQIRQREMVQLFRSCMQDDWMVFGIYPNMHWVQVMGSLQE